MTMGLWNWLGANKDQLGVVLAALGVGGSLFAWVYVRRKKAAAPAQEPTKPTQSATATTGGTALNISGSVSGDVTVKTGLTAEQVEALTRSLTQRLPRSEADANLLASKDAELEELRRAVAALSEAARVPGAGAGEALAALERGDTAKAEALFREIRDREKATAATAETTKAEANKRAAEASRHLGALAFLHDTKAALEAYREATVLDPESLNGWCQHGHLLSRLGEYAEAKKVYERTLTLAGECPSRRAIAYGNLGNVAAKIGDFKAASDFYSDSLKINRDAGNKIGIATNLGNLGSIALMRGSLEQAHKLYDEAFEIHKALGNKRGMAANLGNLGTVAKNRAVALCDEEGLGIADHYYYRALDINEQIDSIEGKAANLGNLGAIELMRGSLEQAHKLCDEAFELHKTLGHKRGMANNLENLGMIAQKGGNAEEAESFYTRSLRFQTEIEDKQGIASSLYNLGCLAEDRDDLTLARTHWTKSLRLFTEIGVAPMAKSVQGRLDGLL